MLDLCAAPGSKTLQLLDAMHASASAACLASDSDNRYDEQRPSGLLIANEIEAKRYACDEEEKEKRKGAKLKPLPAILFPLINRP